MLKVVVVCDKKDTAIDRLAQGLVKYMDNIDYKIVAVHPKRPDREQLERFEKESINADIIDWQYYRSADMLKMKYAWLKDKKQILTHHNPYSITESDWNNYDLIVANNQTIYEKLGKITEKPLELIPNCLDTDFWTFNTEWEPNKNVIMVANRIEGKKGILPVAIACAELNLHFILVGSISSPEYFESIRQTGNVEFHEQISDEKLKELYYKSTIHVCNSVDNFESGTMPILESMITGVPVLTREIGHVPDLNNGENMFIHKGDPEDIEGIKAKLLEMISDKKKLSEVRDKAWQTAKTRSNERRAYMYQKLYREVLSDETPVSVVVPIYDKPDIIAKCLNAIAEQTHKNIEVIVSDDNLEEPNEEIIRDYARYVNFPVRYIRTANIDYGLARARNAAIIEATGKVVVFCDQRMIMEPDAISEFLKYLKPKVWLYGNKGAKKEFVENFSCVYRDDVINAGMFCERIDRYGGMSQECRTRFKNQGGKTEYVESAKAIPKGKSSNRNRKREDIIKMKNRLFKMGMG